MTARALPGGVVSVRVAIRVRRAHGRKLILLPDGAPAPAQARARGATLVAALAMCPKSCA